MNIYDYFDACKVAGIPGERAMLDYQREREEELSDLIEELEERQSHYECYNQHLVER